MQSSFGTGNAKSLSSIRKSEILLLGLLMGLSRTVFEEQQWPLVEENRTWRDERLGRRFRPGPKYASLICVNSLN
jgi:hypothetical protein